MAIRLLAATGLAAAMVFTSVSASVAQAPADQKGPDEPAYPPGSEEAPGFEDFEKGDLSPKDVQEEQEREEDRNILSPSMQDGQPIDGWEADAND